MARIKYYNKQTGQWEYADNVLMSGSTSAVEYVEQELTEEQKEQARENIGAISATAKDNIDMNGFKITNLPLPTTGSEPATKEFVENFTVEGSTYVATDDNNDGNVVLRPYVADADELEFRDHIKNKENPHEVTFEQVGAAPNGYGFGGTAVSLSTSKIESESALNTAIESVCSGMAAGETKLVKWLGYPSGDYNWFGILSKSSANYGSLEVHSAYSKGAIILKTKFSGTWQPLEWVNPPMIAGTEYRTTERWNGKPVYTKLINIGSTKKGDLTIAHNTAIVTPISLDIVNNDQDWLNGSNLFTNVSFNRTNIYLSATADFGYIKITIKYTKE